jgi:thiamine biosynthesis lipoprotein
VKWSLTSFLLCFASWAQAQTTDPGYFVTRSTTAMGTVVQARAYLPVRPSAPKEREVASQLDAAIAEIRRLEGLMTTWSPDSDISRVNAAAGQKAVVVSPEVYDVIAKAQEFSARSSGAFDISFYALRGLWFFDEEPRAQIPDPKALAARLPLINFRAIVLSEKARTVKLQKPGMAINLGGIGKGFAVDAAVKILRARGITDGMVQAGGDLMLFGSKSGAPFKAGIRDPRSLDPSDYFAVCEIKDHAFSTAGDYERSFIREGTRYHHILDPRTGQPARGARSVTVFAKDATTADGLDDVVLILGPERGLRIVESYPDAGAVVVDANNRVHISKSLATLCSVIHPPTPGV